MTHSAEPATGMSAARRSVEEFIGAQVMTITPAQGTFISWVTDILVYIVVLNLFDEFFHDHIHFGSFWISILAAVLFKILLTLVGKVERHVHHGLAERGYAVLALFGAFLVLFFGKLAIIEIINELFEEVEMHGLIYEVAMIITMILVSILMWKIFDSLGRDNPIIEA